MAEESQQLLFGTDSEPDLQATPRPRYHRLGALLLTCTLLGLGSLVKLAPHQKSLRGNEAGVVQDSLSLFEPVDGGAERACRGATSYDNQPTYFLVTSAVDLASCQLQCLQTGCQGVEFHASNGRCELWTRPEGIQASAQFTPSVCYRRVGILEPVDGGLDRACRGSSPGDNNPAYFQIEDLQLFDDCQRECLRTAECRGIEFSVGRCEIWTRPEGIQASISLSGFQCYRAVNTATTSTETPTTQTSQTSTVTSTLTTVTLTSLTTTVSMTLTSTISTLASTLPPSPADPPSLLVDFRGVDGGVDRVCRGADPNDNNPIHFEVFDVDDLEACKQLCAGTSDCVGVESIGRRCEAWTRPAGIQATREAAGYQCLELVTFSLVDGGGSACRGTSAGDNMPEYYEVFTEPTLEDCQQRCANTTDCEGVEYSGTRCEVWNTPILASASMTNGDFQCFRFGSRPRLTFLTEVAASTWSTIGFDAECRGETSEDDSPSYFSEVTASSLQRCQERCLDLTICTGIEYRPGHCELWTRPAGIQATKALVNSVCLQRPSSPPPGAIRTKYVAHYMPWFVGFQSGVYDHWCVGNAHYQSFLGQYNLNDRAIVQQQLDLMKNASIDGVWIDYQLASWNAVIDIVMEETATRGMGVAIVVDSVTNPNIFIESRDKMIEWTNWPHYYRVNGNAVIPVFQTPDVNFEPYPFDAYYIVRRGGPPPSWANGTYPWVTPSLTVLDVYYQEDHTLSSFAVGAAYRGFRDCYKDRTLITPFLQMLEPTLMLASKYQPEFVQVITWNDYSEGTMIEPSWVRPRDVCLSTCVEENIQPCLTSSACDSGFDPLDCTKPYDSFSGPVDPQCNSTATANADDDLRSLTQHIRAEETGALKVQYHSGMFEQKVAEAFNWYSRKAELEYHPPATPQRVDDIMVKK